jgi:hypothetical protein
LVVSSVWAAPHPANPAAMDDPMNFRLFMARHCSAAAPPAEC